MCVKNAGDQIKRYAAFEMEVGPPKPVVRQKSVCSAFSTTSSSYTTLVPVMQSADFGDFDHLFILMCTDCEGHTATQ